MKNIYEIEFKARTGKRREWRVAMNEKLWVTSANGPQTAIKKAERRYRYCDEPIRVLSVKLLGSIDVD